MKNNKIFSLILSGLIFAFVAGGLSATINAQGRYANTYSKNQVKGYVDRLERSSNTFRQDFSREMNRSSLNGTPTEDQFNANVRDYENSVDQLKNQFNRNNSWWDNRSNVQDMLGYARPVNQMMNSLPFARSLEQQWRAMRDDINKVADTFDLPGINGGGWNGGGNDGGWNGGGNAGTPPNWAVGNWTWINGTDNRQMTIDRNGRVTVYALGNTSYGTYNRNVISLDRVSLNVTRSGNGIRLQDSNTGEISNWRNGGGNGGGYVGGNDGGNTSTPPSWAQGTFYSTNVTGYTMTINRNGQITLVGPGATTYGRWYQSSIYINNEVFPATRSGDGLRAYSQTTGQYTNYSRSSSGGGNYDGGGNNGGNTSTPPSWAQGTFYSTNIQGYTMTINRNGQIALVGPGQTSYGRWYQGSIFIDNDEYPATKINNGLSALNRNTGQATIYSRR